MSSLKRGDIILSSTPFAFILKSSLRGKYCDNCFRRKLNAQRCSGCAVAYYCHRDCQKSSWETHRKECSRIRKLKPNYPSDTARLMARVIFQLQDGGYEQSEDLPNGKSRKFEDLLTHYEQIKNNEFRQEHFTSLLVVLKKYLGEENLPSASELFKIYGRVLVNSFTITDKDLNGIGLGLYLGASILDHSCKPNSYASFIGTKIIVRSLYDEPKFDLDLVRISYIDILNTRVKRSKELADGYFFTCNCSLCSDSQRERLASSIQCGNAGCEYPIWIDEEMSKSDPIQPCSNCGFKDFDLDTRQRYSEVLKQTITAIEKTKEEDSSTYENLLQVQESLFHKFNLWTVKTLDMAFERCINNQLWDKALSYGLQNLQGMRYYYGANHPVYAYCLLKLGKIELFLFKFQEALNHLQKAEPILRITHGKDHPLYCSDLEPLLKQARQEAEMMQMSGFSIAKKNIEHY